MLILTLFAMAPAGVSNDTVAKLADGSFERYDEAKIQPSSNRPVNSISKGMGMRAIGRVLNIHRKMASRWLVQVAQALPASPPKTQACSFIEIDELCTFIAKKNLNVGSG